MDRVDVFYNVEKVRKVRTVLKHVVGLENVCSKHSLKFVKKSCVFSFSSNGTGMSPGGQQYQNSRTMAPKMLDSDRGNWLGPKRPIGN